MKSKTVAKLTRLLLFLQSKDIHSMPRAVMLLHMLENGPTRPGELAAQANINPVNVRTFMDAAASLITEESHPTDRRGRLIDLTPAFRAELEEVLK